MNSGCDISSDKWKYLRAVCRSVNKVKQKKAQNQTARNETLKDCMYDLVIRIVKGRDENENKNSAMR